MKGGPESRSPLAGLDGLGEDAGDAAAGPAAPMANREDGQPVDVEALPVGELRQLARLRCEQAEKLRRELVAERAALARAEDARSELILRLARAEGELAELGAELVEALEREQLAFRTQSYQAAVAELRMAEMRRDLDEQRAIVEALRLGLEGPPEPAQQLDGAGEGDVEVDMAASLACEDGGRAEELVRRAKAEAAVAALEHERMLLGPQPRDRARMDGRLKSERRTMFEPCAASAGDGRAAEERSGVLEEVSGGPVGVGGSSCTGGEEPGGAAVPDTRPKASRLNRARWRRSVVAASSAAVFVLFMASSVMFVVRERSSPWSGFQGTL